MQRSLSQIGQQRYFELTWKKTPRLERRRFICYLNEQGFTITDIRRVYPTMSNSTIKTIIQGKNERS